MLSIHSLIRLFSSVTQFSHCLTEKVLLKKNLLYSPKENAFSLFEVLCVLLILALLAGVTWNSSVMGFFQQTDYERIKAIQKSLASSLLMSRQYAVQAQEAISLCGGPATAIKGDCNGNWSAGWFIEQNSQVKTHHLFADDTHIHWSGFPSNKAKIDFYANGHTGYQNGTFYICIEGWQTRIVLNQSGRFYLGPIEAIASGEWITC